MRLSVSILFLATAGLSAQASPATTPAPPNITLLKQQNASALVQNDLITQLQAAQAAKDWPKAEGLAEKLIALDPEDWQYRQALADVRFHKGDYAGALEAYGVALAGAGKAKVTPTLREAMALMYSNEGNAFIKLKRNDEAIQAYTQAAQLSAHPATAWFNLCAVQYNLGMTDGALAACDKAIAADPTKADAYFIKGSLLMGNSSIDAAGKTVAPPGTVEALKRYLELSPKGPHAADVQQMLDYLQGKTP